MGLSRRSIKAFGTVMAVSLLLVFTQNCAKSDSASVGAAAPNNSNGNANGNETDPPLTGWALVKSTQVPVVALTSIYEPAIKLTLGNLAWEDGLYITRDGLSLYAIYMPGDILKAIFDGVTPDVFYKYQRGPLIGQDFSNPLGQPHPWIHADIVLSNRSSITESFNSWSLSDLKLQYYNRGAPQGILNSSNANIFDYFVYTDDSSGSTTIKMLKNVSRNPNVAGASLPANVDEPSYHQDNPHIERYDSADPNKLVLFYDSDNKPGGSGSKDIWYTVSLDGGVNWTNPAAVTTLNTSGEETQPHLYNDGTSWWIYYSATNPADGKLAIFRAKQGVVGDANSWQNKELVVSAGSSAGIGEPTLTAAGDLYFVVVTENKDSASAFDRYDSDPWMLKKR